MVTSDNTESGLLALIADLRVREEEYQLKLEETRRNIEAVQLALALLREKFGAPVTERTARDSLIERIRGLTQQNALIAIAQASSGKVRVREAKRLFLQAGLKKNPKTASPGITSVLSRSNRFEHTGRGEYTLIQQLQPTFLRTG